MIEEGAPFPTFSLTDQDGKIVTNADLLGHKSVIYFYPKDDTPGCTVEACDFRDRFADVPGAQVFGVSPDNERSHRKFIEKFSLNFRLLADKDHELADALGFWVEKSMYGKKYMGIQRTTFLIDPSGKIARVWHKVKPEGHADEVLQAVKALK